jgi:hypothetical protein
VPCDSFVSVIIVTKLLRKYPFRSGVAVSYERRRALQIRSLAVSWSTACCQPHVDPSVTFKRTGDLNIVQPSERGPSYFGRRAFYRFGLAWPTQHVSNFPFGWRCCELQMLLLSDFVFCCCIHYIHRSIGVVIFVVELSSVVALPWRRVGVTPRTKEFCSTRTGRYSRYRQTVTFNRIPRSPQGRHMRTDGGTMSSIVH